MVSFPEPKTIKTNGIDMAVYDGGTDGRRAGGAVPRFSPNSPIPGGTRFRRWPRPAFMYWRLTSAAMACRRGLEPSPITTWST